MGVHRQSVSRSIQYSDYSSGDELPPQSSPEPTNNEISHDEDEDEDESSSSYDNNQTKIEQNKQNTKKRTSSLIKSKVNTISSKFDENKENENSKNRQRGLSNSGGTSRTAKKASLAARWEQSVKANSTKNIHDSQKKYAPKKIKSIHDGSGSYKFKNHWQNKDESQKQYKQKRNV